MLAEAHRGQVDHFDQGCVSFIQSVVVCDVRWIRATWTTSKHRFPLEEPTRTNLAEHGEKVGHHELQTAHADEERRLLQGQSQLWQQKLEFREAHQRNLIEIKEKRKYHSSAFGTILRRKLILDQNTVMELSGRLQELQNEANCMIDSEDLQDAESNSSGNSHVTSRPVSFPPHPIPEGMLRHSFVTPRRKEGPPCIWETHGISGNVFANPLASSSAPHPQELNPWGTTIEEPLQMSTAEKSERPEQNRVLDASLDRQPKIRSSSVEETLQRIVGQTNNDCRCQQPLLAGRWGSRPRYVLVHNFQRKGCNGSKKWRWLIQWMN